MNFREMLARGAVAIVLIILTAVSGSSFSCQAVVNSFSGSRDQNIEQGPEILNTVSLVHGCVRDLTRKLYSVFNSFTSLSGLWF